MARRRRQFGRWPDERPTYNIREDDPFTNINFHSGPVQRGRLWELSRYYRFDFKKNWKGYGHEESSISVSGRCHHWYHGHGGPITRSSVAGRRLGSGSRWRTYCRRRHRRHRLQRICLWPRLRLLWRTEWLLWRIRPGILRWLRVLLCTRLLWPPVPTRCSPSIRLRAAVLWRIWFSLVRCNVEVRDERRLRLLTDLHHNIIRGLAHDEQRARNLLERKRRPMAFMSRGRTRLCCPSRERVLRRQITPVELGDFLRKGNAGPEHQALRHMIGGLLDG
jgi:hypothetical protein